jgi:hypothetical protein
MAGQAALGGQSLMAGQGAMAGPGPAGDPAAGGAAVNGPQNQPAGTKPGSKKPTRSQRKAAKAAQDEMQN